ncbi:hypothetical protein EFZ10_16720 (plasmid) [Tatumella sp. TA1]|uniref:Lipoprotein n=2 Tax=Candidatus Erwinia dacicola TaxID=252393 RepID=A0A328TQE7_9GAMM|nr:hypothetical protein [Candidatus Erwinia dacicola]QGX93267.1 hypothetical protein EFZ10_16720 [Tatumella sp. TA1]RAP70036.1 hypothetical protein ACZ87_03167 [Candidatus Erwinia dacicola]
MKPIIALSFIAAGALALSGCNDPKEANESNFKTAAQQYLDTTYPECYFKANFPFKTDGLDFGNTRAVLKALAAKGLLTETEISRKHYEKSWGSEAHDVVVNNYVLTDEGKKYYKAGKETNALGKDTGGFCFGKAKVETITNFTEPSDAMGQKISRVNYTYTVTDIPEWAKSDDIIAASSKLKEDVASAQNPVSAKAVFVLTNKGWMHERLFNKR